MNKSLEVSLFKVINDKDIVMGMAFMVEDSLIVTCSHVLNSCNVGLGDKVKLYNNREEVFEAKVLVYEDPIKDDIAILKAVDQDFVKELPPLKLGTARHYSGNIVQIYDYSAPGDYKGIWVHGKIQNFIKHESKHEMLQLEATSITQGVSGSPVICVSTHRVIGFISEFLPNTSLVWATPSDLISSVYPKIKLHYPENIERFLSEVIRYSKEIPYLTLGEIGLSKKLNDIYVPLKARQQSKDIRNNSLEILELSDNDRVVFADAIMSAEITKPILIYGAPGSGKSTLLRQLALHAWESPGIIGLDKPYFPLLISLRFLVQYDGTIENRIIQSLTNEMMLDVKLEEDFLKMWPSITSANWIFLFDGLDEVTPDNLYNLQHLIFKLLRDFQDAKIVITSRLTDWEIVKNIESQFIVFDLLPFSANQVDAFSLRWFGKDHKMFISKLERMNIQELSRNPLLVTIAAIVFQQNKNLPFNRTLLYDQFIKIWLDEAIKKGVKEMLGEEAVDLAKFYFSGLAREILEHDKELSNDDILNSCRKYFAETLHFSFDKAEVIAKKFISIMGRRSGIFCKFGEVYRFLHPTFVEYLAAYDIFRKYKNDVVSIEEYVLLYNTERWREVIIFILSMMDDATLQIENLLGLENHGAQFAGRAIQEGIHIDEQTQIRIVERLFGDAEKYTNFSPYLDTLQGLLFREDVVDYFLHIASNSDLNSNLRVASAQVLNKLLDKTYAYNAFIDIIKDDNVEAMTRVISAAFLAKIDYKQDAIDWLSDLGTRAGIAYWIREEAAEQLKILGEEAAAADIAIHVDDQRKSSLRDSNNFLTAPFFFYDNPHLMLIYEELLANERIKFIDEYFFDSECILCAMEYLNSISEDGEDLDKINYEFLALGYIDDDQLIKFLLTESIDGYYKGIVMDYFFDNSRLSIISELEILFKYENDAEIKKTIISTIQEIKDRFFN